MRLNEQEVDAIKESARKVFGDTVKVYLFGSRLDDDKKGGDIDLYVRADDKHTTYEHKIKFLVELQKRIGEQKIDVVISRDQHSLIEQSAIKHGIAL